MHEREGAPHPNQPELVLPSEVAEQPRHLPTEVTVASPLRFAAALALRTIPEERHPYRQAAAEAIPPAWRALTDVAVRPQQEPSGELWAAAHHHVLTALLAYPDDARPAVQLRLLALPAVDGASLRLSFRLGGSATMAEAAQTSLRDFATLFLHAAAGLLLAYDLHTPVADVAGGPGEDEGVWDLVELAAPTEALPAPIPGRLPLPQLPAAGGPLISVPPWSGRLPPAARAPGS